MTLISLHLMARISMAYLINLVTTYYSLIDEFDFVRVVV